MWKRQRTLAGLVSTILMPAFLALNRRKQPIRSNLTFTWAPYCVLRQFSKWCPSIYIMMKIKSQAIRGWKEGECCLPNDGTYNQTAPRKWIMWGWDMSSEDWSSATAFPLTSYLMWCPPVWGPPQPLLSSSRFDIGPNESTNCLTFSVGNKANGGQGKT